MSKQLISQMYKNDEYKLPLTLQIKKPEHKIPVLLFNGADDGDRTHE